MKRQVETSRQVLGNVALILPVLPPGSVIRDVMPSVSRLLDESLTIPFQPEPLGLTQQRLAAPLDPVPLALSAFAWDSSPSRRSALFGRVVSSIPRRRLFRPFRRWIARRWQRFDPHVDPGFIPGASLAHLDFEPVVDDEDNLLRDLEEEGVTATWSVLDYAWTPGRHWERTWVDGIHEQDYLAWARMAVRSQTDLVILDLGQAWPDILAAKPADSRRFRRSARRVDRRIGKLLFGRSGRRIRDVLLLFVESPLGAEGRIHLERTLRAERFQAGRDYVAVIHPTFAQVWSLRRESRALLADLVEKLPGARVHPLDAIPGVGDAGISIVDTDEPENAIHSADKAVGRRWGDWVVTAKPSVVFHPNHFDGGSPRRTATGWADPSPESQGLAVFAGNGWALPGEIPATANVDFLRNILLDTYLPETE